MILFSIIQGARVLPSLPSATQRHWLGANCARVGSEAAPQAHYVAPGHDLVHEYIDRESRRKGTKGRKQFASLFEDAHKRSDTRRDQALSALLLDKPFSRTRPAIDKDRNKEISRQKSRRVFFSFAKARDLGPARLGSYDSRHKLHPSF